MALHSEVVDANKNSWSQSGKVIALETIKDSMADEEPWLPSQYVFYP